MNKYYRIDIKIRNNKILKLIESNGYKNITDFCRTNKMAPKTLVDIINMKISPLLHNGDFRNIVKRMATALKVLPSELFNNQQLYFQLEDNKKTIEVDAEQIFMLQNENLSLENNLINDEISKLLEKTLETLPARIKKSLEMRHGLNGYNESNLDEIGRELNVTRERARQIVCKGYRLLRHPSIIEELKDYINDN